ncbi:MAG: hypothetical protein ACK5O2_04755, partial [Microthrixaceae bacterium]
GKATWGALVEAHAERTHEGEFIAAFNNGRALLRASDGLRGRTPLRVEWKGPHRDPADNAVPADLRIDHVYLVSCKYLSKVLHNASPWALFERCLAGSPNRKGDDWFEEVAPAQHQAHYDSVRRLLDGGEKLPLRVGGLDADQRRMLATAREVTSHESATAYAELADAVAVESARRWSNQLRTRTQQRSMLWRLLRLSATPYFVLGTGAGENLRIRVATPWDWNQVWELLTLDIEAVPAGQPVVAWRAEVRRRTEVTDDDPAGLRSDREVRGHVEIRWSHGRFGGSPEAKVYLDSPHGEVPGYIALR